MTFLPIVARELRVAARRRVTYWVRTGAALGVVVMGTFMFLMMQREAPHEIALILFRILTGSAVLYSLLSGIRDTSDALSSEKREGTLGLLFLTDLKGYDVVFGKLAASSLNAFYGVLAVLPMLAVPLLMGGVTLGEFERIALVAVNALFFSLALGMWISAMCQSGRRAAVTTSLLLVLFTAVFPACGAWLAVTARAGRVDRFFLTPSVGFNYFSAWDSSFKTGPDDFWWSLAIIHCLGWLFLLLASLIAPRAWQDRPAGAHRLRWRERWELWSHGNLSERMAFRKRLLDRNAFFWLSARARLKPALVWGVMGILGCGWCWGMSKFHRDWLNAFVYIMTGIVLNLMLKAWFASEAGRQLAEDRKRGSLELLLSTPLTVRDILRGQSLALRRQFLGPVVVVLLVGCLFLFETLKDLAADEERAGYRLFWIGGMVLLVADLVALYWVGMWQGLTAKNPNRSASASVARVLILPAVAWALVLLVVVLASMRGGHEPTPNFFIGLWFGIGLVADIAFSALSRHKLLSEFRLAAVQRYSPRPGFLRRLFTGGEKGGADLPPVIAVQK
jgi:ABC-type Na+ efflux pump permease subunit